MRPIVIVVLLALAAPAAADEPDRPFRASIGAGGSLLFTGTGGLSRWRGDAHLGVMPGGPFGRFGLVAALRHVTYDPRFDDGLATLGVHYEAGAARPRLALALHGDVGTTIDGFAPVIGGGIETHLWLIPSLVRPIALVFDLTAHLVIDGTDDTRLMIGSATRLTLAF